MPRKNTVIPIESFDPRLRDLLLRGSKERIEIPCETKRQRVNLRNQLMDYRAAARRANLAEANQLYRAKMSLGEVKDDKFILIIAPRGSEFDSVLGSETSRPAVQRIGGVDPLDSLPTEEEKK